MVAAIVQKIQINKLAQIEQKKINSPNNHDRPHTVQLRVMKQRKNFKHHNGLCKNVRWINQQSYFKFQMSVQLYTHGKRKSMLGWSICVARGKRQTINNFLCGCIHANEVYNFGQIQMYMYM